MIFSKTYYMVTACGISKNWLRLYILFISLFRNTTAKFKWQWQFPKMLKTRDMHKALINTQLILLKEVYLSFLDRVLKSTKNSLVKIF